MKSSKVMLGVERTTKWAALSVATEVGGTGHLDPVELVALERGDHRIGGAEELQPEAVDMRLRAVEVRVPLEQRDLLRRVLVQDERPAGDDRRGVAEPRQRLAVAGGVLGPDVLGEDRHLLDLREHVRHGLLVGQHHGGGVRRGGALHVGDVTRGVGRRAVLVLEDRAVGPGDVGGRQRLAVGPLGVRLGVERPDGPVGAVLPAAREVRDELQLGVVLDQHRDRCTRRSSRHPPGTPRTG